MKTIAVKEVKYIEEYKLEIIFADDKKKVVDFKHFFNTHSHPQYNKYKKTENFKKFRIQNGNVVWGKDWDLIFPVYNLYQGKVD